MKGFNRRQFLEFMGKSSTLSAIAGSTTLLSACSNLKTQKSQPLPFHPILPSRKDELVLAKGFHQKVLISWNDPINSTEFFGYNNDFTAFIPLIPKNPYEGLLWINHEYPSEIFVSGYNKKDAVKKTKQQVQKEQLSVGGSILHIKKNTQNSHWTIIKDSRYNRRITGQTKIPFSNKETIKGKQLAIGTMGNCAGGVTPWQTVLTCEENTQNYYGDLYFIKGQRKVTSRKFHWDAHFNFPPEHYGWVVEVDPKTGSAQKHIGLGRMSHECATVSPQIKNGRVAVYTGDDSANEHLYKFISDQPNNLSKGTLYVANLEKGQWLPLNRKTDSRLKKAFKSDLEMLIRTREAAKIVGATPLDRPEDIEIDPQAGSIYVTLTNNKKKGNYHGSILKIMETGNDHFALNFTSKTFLSGGTETGFACPDNMVFDKKGNLWVTSDISEKDMKKTQYLPFKNNGLFYIPTTGVNAGNVYQVASAPTDAELTGPSFSPDGKTLFLSVQHPGARTKNIQKPTSQWPAGNTPKPSVVTIEGPALDALAT